MVRMHHNRASAGAYHLVPLLYPRNVDGVYHADAGAFLKRLADIYYRVCRRYDLKRSYVRYRKDRRIQNLQKKIMEDLDFGEELSDEQLKELISKYRLKETSFNSYYNDSFDRGNTFTPQISLDDDNASSMSFNGGYGKY